MKSFIANDFNNKSWCIGYIFIIFRADIIQKFVIKDLDSDQILNELLYKTYVRIYLFMIRDGLKKML